MADEQQQTVAGKVEAAPGVETSTETKPVDLTAGVPDGHIDKTDMTIPEPRRERIEHTEAVVHEKDKENNVTGWHKEPAGV